MAGMSLNGFKGEVILETQIHHKGLHGLDRLRTKCNMTKKKYEGQNQKPPKGKYGVLIRN